MKRMIAAIVLMMGTTVYAAAPAKVLLLPFESVGDSPKPWVAKALQQNLLAELNRFSSVTPVTRETAAGELTSALVLAEDAKADYVIFGSYQTAGTDLRITGQVVDVAKKESVAGLKATGTQRDLFGLEDVIANQVKRALPQPVQTAAAKPDMLPHPTPPDPEPAPAPTVTVNDRTRELEAEIDRAIERLKYTPPYYREPDYYYPGNYYYSGLYAPYVYYTVPHYYAPNHRHRHSHRGYHHGGGWGGRGAYIGASQTTRSPIGSVGYGVPRGGNYMNMGRISR